MPRPFRALPLLAALGLAGCAAPRVTPAITDAESLVRAMHARYADRWYPTLTFTQTTTRVLPNDSTVVEEWREWAAIPGRLRIEVTGGPTFLFANDSTYVIRDGRAVNRIGQMNPLMTLGFDVYRQPPERTLEQLRRHGFDLARFHAGTLDGTPVYVVGAERGDTVSRQFAVEAERLLFVRLIEPVPNQPGKTQHVRFLGYRPLGEAWIAPEVEITVDGRRVFHELYSDIRIGDPLDPALFTPPGAG